MKRPLFIFSIYLLAYIGLITLFRSVVDDHKIEITTTAQAEEVRIAESESTK